MASLFNQCILAKTQNQINHCDEIKKEYSWLLPSCTLELNETTSWARVGQAKDIASSNNPRVKDLSRSRHWVWDPTRRRAIKEWSIAINRCWINNLDAVCRITYGLYPILL